MADQELVKDAQSYAKMAAKKRRLQSDLDELTKEMSQLEERLSESFITHGVSLMKVPGGTVHTREEIWPALIVADGATKDEARAGAVAALEAMGHSNLITFNQQSMRGLVRELMDDEGRLPPPLGDYLRAEKRHRLGVREVK